MTRRLRAIAVLVALAMTAAGCAAGRAFRQGEAAVQAGDVDQAVAYYRRAVQADPDNARYKIALERAMLAASRVHLDRAKDFEAHDQLDAAISEYRLGAEYDPSNRLAASKVAELERTVRDRVEAARPRPPIEQARERARQALAEPMLNPASREPIIVRFNNTSLRDVLSAIGGMTGINVVYDPQVSNQQVTLQLDGVTLEQALTEIMTMTQNAYKVLSDRSILVFPDNAQKHGQYDDQVVRTFYVSHADATQLVQLLSVIVRLPGLPIIPAIAVNEQNNTITVRGTAPVVDIIGRVIEQNDKPRAEVMFDVEILEVDRTRAKQYGLNLSQYAVGGIFSPESAPTTDATPPGSVSSGVPFNLNTISRGVSTADFYFAVPAAIVRFLESDSHTKLVAKPQLRGAEGAKLTLSLGDDVPIVTTSYTPIASGGASVNPLNSFQFRSVGINIEMTPRVTLEGDILIDLNVESSSRGSDVNIAGTNYPSFGSRKVGTQLRLRDGEPNLLAGLLREDDNRHRRRACQAPSTCRACAPALRRDGSNQQADRHRDAAHAPHHPDQGDQQRRPAPGLHRIAAEPRRGRPAAAHCVARLARRTGHHSGAGHEPGAAGRAAREPDLPARGQRDDYAAARLVTDSRHRPRAPRARAGLSTAGSSAAGGGSARAASGGADLDPCAAPGRRDDQWRRIRGRAAHDAADDERRRRPVHRADYDRQRGTAVDDHADADLRSGPVVACGRCRRAVSCAPAAPRRPSRSR